MRLAGTASGGRRGGPPRCGRRARSYGHLQLLTCKVVCIYLLLYFYIQKSSVYYIYIQDQLMPTPFYTIPRRKRPPHAVHTMPCHPTTASVHSVTALQPKSAAFLGILGAVPNTAQDGPKAASDGLEGPHDGPRRAQGNPKTAPRRPKNTHDGPRTAPSLPQDAPGLPTSECSDLLETAGLGRHGCSLPGGRGCCRACCCH